MSRWHTMLFLIMLLCTPAVAFSAEQSKPGETAYFAKYDGSGITLSDFNKFISEIEQQKGYKISLADKQTLLKIFIDDELLYKKALSKNIDKEPKVIEKIRRATRKVIIEHLMADYYSGIKVTEEEALEHYNANKDTYARPALYTGFFYTIAPKSKAVDSSKGQAIAHEMQRLIAGNNFAALEIAVLNGISEKNQDFKIVLWRAENHYKGKQISIPKPAAEEFTKLKPNSMTVIRHEDQHIIAVLNSVVPAETENYETAKGSIIAGLKDAKLKKAYFELIDSLSKEYNLVTNYDLLK